MFSFPNKSKSPSTPEANGLLHLAFEVNEIQKTRAYILAKNLFNKEIRIDEYTNKRFFFTSDPVDLPIEFIRFN